LHINTYTSTVSAVTLIVTVALSLFAH